MEPIKASPVAVSFAKALESKPEPTGKPEPAPVAKAEATPEADAPVAEKHIGEVEAGAKAPTLEELQEKHGNMDLTYQQRKAQKEAYDRREAGLTPEQKAHRDKLLKDFYDRISQ